LDGGGGGVDIVEDSEGASSGETGPMGTASCWAKLSPHRPQWRVFFPENNRPHNKAGRIDPQGPDAPYEDPALVGSER